MPRIKDPIKVENIVEYFYSFVNKGDSRGDCWVWTGGERGSGYGGFYDNKGTQHYAHKFAYFQARGRRYDARMRLVHKCGNPMCVNPTHLKPHGVKQREGYKISVDKATQIVYTYRTLKERLNGLGKEFDISLANVGLMDRIAKRFKISRSSMYKLIREVED